MGKVVNQIIAQRAGRTLATEPEILSSDSNDLENCVVCEDPTHTWIDDGTAPVCYECFMEQSTLINDILCYAAYLGYYTTDDIVTKNLPLEAAVVTILVSDGGEVTLTELVSELNQPGQVILLSLERHIALDSPVIKKTSTNCFRLMRPEDFQEEINDV